MSSNPIIGSPPRSGTIKRTVSFPGAGASDRAEAGYGSTPGDAPSTSSDWTDASRVRVAGRLLLTIAVFGILGSLLPFFAVGWANKLGTPSVSRTGASVSALQSLQSMPAVSALGQAPGEGDANLLGTPLKPCSSSDQGSTGWTRSGSCAWSPDDSGYHEVRTRHAARPERAPARDRDPHLASSSFQHPSPCASEESFSFFTDVFLGAFHLTFSTASRRERLRYA